MSAVREGEEVLNVRVGGNAVELAEGEYSPYRRVTRGSRTGTSDRVLVFTPGAPAVQILVSAMRALDRSKLVVGLSRGRLASCLCESNGNDGPARLVLAYPAEVEVAWNHLMRDSDLDMAQAR